MVKSRGQHEILTYEYSEITHGIFLSVTKSKKHIVEKAGKQICTAHVTGAIRKLFESNGYNFIEKSITYYYGRQNVFDFRISVTKEVKGKEIQALRVHVLGTNLSDSRDNAKKLAQKIWAVYHVKPIQAELLTRAECG